MELMTKSQYAKHRGVSAAMITKLAQEDRILITPEGKVDVEISDTLLDAFSDALNPRQSLSDKLTNIGNYSSERSRLTKYKADLAQLDFEKAQGKLTEVSTVSNAAFSTARRVRDGFMNLLDRLPPLLAPLTEHHDIRNLLNTEFRNVLEELHNEFISRSEKQ